MKALILAACFPAAIAATSASALADAKPYVTLSAGAVMPQDTDYAATIGLTSVAGAVEFDTGWMGTVAIGTRFDTGFAVEAEAGYLAFEYDSITGTISPPPTPISATVDAEVSAFTLMGNALFFFDAGAGWHPYVGAGAGAVFFEEELNAVGGVPLTASNESTEFAVQAIAGLSFDVSDGVEFGVRYRYMWADTGGGGVENFSGHSVSATLTFALN